ncbi:MAG: Uncharacterised protein [Arcobacter lacus]|nr:MAG: Uncharacterised protein [Arcobacter lacus]
MVLKKSLKLLALNSSKAWLINLPFLPNLAINSSVDRVFVKLHLPPPVAFSFAAILFSFSMSKTFLFSLAALILAKIPAGPPPIITTS